MWNAKHPTEGSKNTQEIVNSEAQTTNVWFAADAGPTDVPRRTVYIQLFQMLVLICLFSS